MGKAIFKEIMNEDFSFLENLPVLVERHQSTDWSFLDCSVVFHCIDKMQFVYSPVDGYLIVFSF